LDSRRRSLAGLSSLLVGLKKKKGEERCKKGRVFIFEIQIPKSNLFARILKTYRKKIDSRGFNHDKKVKAKG
jgi:hypothetical protein